MRFRNIAENFFDVADLNDGERDYLAYVALGVLVANGYSSSCRIVVDRDLETFFGIALDCSQLGNAGSRGQCRMKTAGAAYSAHCVRVPFVEITGGKDAQGLWGIVGCNEVLRITEDPDLFVSSR